MPKRISIRTKMLLAFGLNAFFYGVLLYVNLAHEDRYWGNIFGKNLPILLSEYVIGALLIFAWLFLAERIHEQFERWFGDEIISNGGFWPNLGALLCFAVANVGVNQGGIQIIYWLQTLLLESPDLTLRETTPYARMSLRYNDVNYLIMSMLAYYLLTYRRVVRRLDEANLRAEHAQRKQVQSQFTLLQSQVNPHFLFNSLSTLSALAHTDVECSEQFIQHLSKAYRYMLENRQSPTVPLCAELEFLQAYTFLQQKRFGDKLHIETYIAPAEAEGYYVVPLTLQALVERAIRHNRMSAACPLRIHIRLHEGGLQVENNRQARYEPDYSIGNCDWPTFESCYAVLTQGNKTPHDTSSEVSWITHVPLIHQPAAHV